MTILHRRKPLVLILIFSIIYSLLFGNGQVLANQGNPDSSYLTSSEKGKKQILAETYSIPKEEIQSQLNDGYTIDQIETAILENRNEYKTVLENKGVGFLNTSHKVNSVIRFDEKLELGSAQQQGRETLEVNNNPPENYEYVNTHPDEAPYSVQISNELVSTLSGSLSLSYTDMELPGRNGLSFMLQRRYNSNDSQFYKVYGSSTRKTHFESLYPIGVGWSWDLSSIEQSDGKMYVHLQGGGVYEVNGQYFRDYPWIDLSFAHDTSVTVGNEVSAYALKSVRGINQYFSQDGRIIQISDLYNNKIQFEYTYHNSYGKVLSRITDAIGNIITITYSENEVILTKSTEQVIYKKIKANGKELLGQVIDQENRKTTFHYRIAPALDLSVGNPYALLTEISHPTGALTAYEFDENPIERFVDFSYTNQVYRIKSRVDVLTEKDGGQQERNRITFSYSGDLGSAYKTDLVFSTTLNDGRKETTFHNKKDFIEENALSFFYNTSIVASAGNWRKITEFTYDEVRHITEPINTKEYWQQVNTGQSSQIVETSAQFDAYGNVLQSTNALGATTRYTFDSINVGLVKEIYEPVSSSQTRYTLFHRNDKGTVTQITVRDGGPSGAIMQQINYENLDAYGNAQQTRIKNGDTDILNTTEYSAVYQGAFPTMQTVSVTAPNGAKSTIQEDYTYDIASGRLLSHINGNRHEYKYEYDQLGRFIKAINPDLSVFSVRYEDMNNEIEYTNENGIKTLTKWDPLGLKVSEGIIEWGGYKAKQKFGYDDYGRMIWSEDAVGNRTQYYYDEWDRQTSLIYPDQLLSQYVYDVIEQSVTITDPEGNTAKDYFDKLDRISHKEFNGVQTISYEYDFAGNVRSEKDALNLETNFEYDIQGRLTSVINSLLEETKYHYDMMGNLVSITYPDQQLTSKHYDELGRVIQSLDTKGIAEQYFYDANNNLIKFIDRKGVEFSYEYDSRDFLRKTISPDEIVTFTYDLVGNRKTMTDQTGLTAYTYSPTTGDLMIVTYPDGKQIKYDYNETGMRKALVDPFGAVSYYTYDSRQRLATVGPQADGSEAEVRYTYYGNDLLKQGTQRSNITSNYTYDEQLRLSTITQRNNNGLLHSYEYDYDLNNNLITKVEDGTPYSFTYDELDRIKTSSQQEGTYTYDLRGNRKTLKAEGFHEKQDFEYTYDTKNRLVNVTLDDNSSVAYKYNGDGLLHERTEGGQTIRYYYDGDQIIAEGQVINGESIRKASYTRGVELIYREDVQGKTYYLHNGHGDVTELKDSTGNITLNRYEYDIWGNPIDVHENVENPFRYSGELWDNTAKLQYLRARWYDPSNGRFISKDTYEGDITNPLSLNRYTYVHNNPLRYNDPTGHAINNVQLDAYLQIAKNEGPDSEAWWQVRSELGSEVQYLYPGDNNNQFKYLFNLATGNHYEKEKNNEGSAKWANEQLEEMFELDASMEQMSLGMLNIGGGVRRIVSLIKGEAALVKAAQQMGKNPAVQKEADDLVAKFVKGNTNPGLGTKNLTRDIYYLRGREGARVFYRMTDGEMHILAKANKANEQAVIDVIYKIYGK